ncbi:MAG: hypothetical protein QOE54_1570 [Streptosporangiaceae bacterium]|nr:hypothetical protein [Streptosporangiaceae bacterium]
MIATLSYRRRRAAQPLAGAYPSVTKAWVDSGYKRSVIEAGAAQGIDVEVITKDPEKEGFHPTFAQVENRSRRRLGE